MRFKVNKVKTNIILYKEFLKYYKLASKDAINKTKPKIRADAVKQFKVKKKSFQNSFRTQIFDTNKTKPMGVIYYNNAHWFDVHLKNTIISKKSKRMIVPINRLQTKSAFNRKFRRLESQKRLFTKNGVIYEIKKTKRNRKVIPIALLKDTVELKERSDFTEKARLHHLTALSKHLKAFK